MIIDILILVVVLGGAIYGFCRGIISQVGQVCALIAGIVLARIFGDSVARFFAGDGEIGFLDYAAAYTIVFIGAFLLTWLIVRIFRKAVRDVKLGIVDRLAGAIFKSALWVFILSIILNIYLLIVQNPRGLDYPGRPWREAVVNFAPAVLGFLNQEINKGQNG